MYFGKSQKEIKDLILAEAKLNVASSSDYKEQLYKEILMNPDLYKQLDDAVFCELETEPLADVGASKQVTKTFAPGDERVILELGSLAADRFCPSSQRIARVDATADAAEELFDSLCDATTSEDDIVSLDDDAFSSGNDEAPRSSVDVPVTSANITELSASVLASVSQRHRKTASSYLRKRRSSVATY